MTDYALTATLDAPFEHVVAATRAALAAQGFGVLTEIDVAATMKTKLGAELAPYLILGACNPQLALRALEIEPTLGLLLPCTVTVRHLSADHTEVAALDPDVMVGVTENSELTDIATEARARLRSVLVEVRGASRS